MKKTGEILFYIALSIELAILIIDKSSFVNPIEGRLFQITFLFFLSKVFLTRYTGREKLTIVAFAILGAISYTFTGRNEIIRIVIFIAACKDLNMKDVLKYVFWVTLCGCACLIILSLTGILGTIKMTDIFRADVIETRYCFGLGHPNALHCMFFMLTLLWLYLWGEDIKIWKSLIIIAMNCGLFLLTKSKTGAAMTIFAVVITLIGRYKKIKEKSLIYGLTVMELAGCVGLAWVAAACSRTLPYHDNLRMLDRLLSDRIINLYYGSATHEGILTTWRWFGVPENKYYFDMGWVRLFYWYGIIPAFLYICVLVVLIRQLKIQKDYMGVVMLASIFLYMLVEAHTVSVYIARDYTLFLLGKYWCDMLPGNNRAESFWWEFPWLVNREKTSN